MKARAGSMLALGALLLLLLLQAAPARAEGQATCNRAWAGQASSVRLCPTAQSPYDQLRQRLSADVSQALATMQKLSLAVDETSSTAQLLSDQLTQQEAHITDLQNQVAQLDQQISDLQSRIDIEQAQVGALARAMYRQPSSFLDIIASSGNLADTLTSTADLIIAGERAHSLQDKLKSDLATVQADQAARQTDLDQSTAATAQVQAGLDQLTSVQSQLNDLTSQLSDLISQIQFAAAGIDGQSPDVAAALVQLLEQQELDLIQQADAAIWAQANAGAGLLVDLLQLPSSSGPSGLRMSSPLPGGVMTQRFGPTSLAIEPALGNYAHFHTGVDLAARLGTPVLAAADGVVVAVGHTAMGYGNYVIIAHGSGVLTLYAHLLSTDVTVGDAVARTQVIGLEGATGLATGPHVHFEVRINGQVVDPMRYLPPI